MRIVLLFCAFLLQAFAADLSGPVPGFVFDPQLQAIRPMLGLPGAAYLGPPLVVGVIASGIEAASVAPDGSAALALRRGDLFLIADLRNTPNPIPIQSAIANIDLLAWGRDASFAVVYSSRLRRAQVIRDIAIAPRAGDPLDLSSLPGPLSSLLPLSERALVAAVQSPDSGGVFLVEVDAAPKLLARATNPISLALSSQTRDLFFADRDQQQIWQIQKFDTSPAPVLFAEQAGGLAAPVGVQVSADGQRVFVANAASRKLEIYNASSRTVLSRIDLDFTPTVLEPLSDSLIFRLNSATADQPLWVLGASDNPAVYFVPAGRGE